MGSSDISEVVTTSASGSVSGIPPGVTINLRGEINAVATGDNLPRKFANINVAVGQQTSSTNALRGGCDAIPAAGCCPLRSGCRWPAAS
jgi:hypothetical protein